MYLKQVTCVLHELSVGPVLLEKLILWQFLQDTGGLQLVGVSRILVIKVLVLRLIRDVMAF